MDAAKQRRQRRIAAFQAIQTTLRRHGVDTSEFAFYDQPAFVEQERAESEYLELYAKWVVLREIDEEYETHARSIVPRLGQMIAGSLREDGMQASCVAATALMTRMLDRLHVWSFGIVGRATFSTRQPPMWRGLHTADVGDFPGAFLGHCWVCAPPYFVVDVAAALQRWGSDPIRRFIPDVVLDDRGRRIKPRVEDVVSARMRDEYRARYGGLEAGLHYKLEP